MINELTVSLKLPIIIFRAEDVAYIVLFLNNDVTAYTKKKSHVRTTKFALLKALVYLFQNLVKFFVRLKSVIA